MKVAYVDKDATPREYAASEKFLRGFARKLYRDEVPRQKNEAEEVLRATKSEQDRVVKKANGIQQSIDKNRQRRKDLEAELVRNDEELKQLELNVQHNAKQQEISRQQVQDMEKSVEVVRAKLKDIKALVAGNKQVSSVFPRNPPLPLPGGESRMLWKQFPSIPGIFTQRCMRLPLRLFISVILEGPW